MKSKETTVKEQSNTFSTVIDIRKFYQVKACFCFFIARKSQKNYIYIYIHIYSKEQKSVPHM